MSDNPQQILLIEDNRDDVFLMRRAVQKAGVPWALTVLIDGQQALDFFNRAADFALPTNRPSLIFLDLKLPYVSGFDVLLSMQQQSQWKDIPVVILTSSPEERDMRRALALGAKAYLIKPPDEELLRKIAQGDWEGVEQARSPLRSYTLDR